MRSAVPENSRFLASLPNLRGWKSSFLAEVAMAEQCAKMRALRTFDGTGIVFEAEVQALQA